MTTAASWLSRWRAFRESPPVPVQLGFVLCATALLVFLGARAVRGAQPEVGDKQPEVVGRRSVEPTVTTANLSGPPYTAPVTQPKLFDWLIGDTPYLGVTPRAARPNITGPTLCSTPVPGVQPVPIAVQKEVLQNYDETNIPYPEVTMERLIPLELGGSDELANIWPRLDGSANHAALFDQLREDVCAGRLTLEAAQQQAVAA